MNSNPALGLIGFWMMLQLAATIAILLGGIYALYCLGRASSGLDRMASAMEEWVEQQRAASTPTLPGNAAFPSVPTGVPLSQRLQQSPAAPVSPASASANVPMGTPTSIPVTSPSDTAAPIASPNVQAEPFSPAPPTIVPTAAPSTSVSEYSRPDESTS